MWFAEFAGRCDLHGGMGAEKFSCQISIDGPPWSSYASIERDSKYSPLPDDDQPKGWRWGIQAEGWAMAVLSETAHTRTFPDAILSRAYALSSAIIMHWSSQAWSIVYVTYNMTMHRPASSSARARGGV